MKDRSGKELNPKEVVEITINNLCAINVPAGLMEQIGVPLYQNINNLKILLQAMNDAEKEPEPDLNIGELNLGQPEIKIVPVEGDDANDA